MKLRVANKIIFKNNLDSYRISTLVRANKRINKTSSNKENNKYWYNLMDEIGPEGRAYLLRFDYAGEALKILMEET